MLRLVSCFLDSRLDLFERRLKAQSHRLKQAASELIPRGLRTPRGSPIDPDDETRAGEGGEPRRKYKIDTDKEIERLRLKVSLYPKREDAVGLIDLCAVRFSLRPKSTTCPNSGNPLRSFGLGTRSVSLLHPNPRRS